MAQRPERPTIKTRAGAAHQNAIEQLLGLLGADTLDSFSDECFMVLPNVVPCDFVSVLYRSDGGRLLRERDSLGRVPSPEFMQRYGELTPAARLVTNNPGVRVLPSRLGLPASDEELHRMDFYHEVMKPQGWRHAVALCFGNTKAAKFPSLVVTLNRREGRADFSDAELETLERCHHLLETAVKRIFEREGANAVYDAIASASRYERHGLVVLDSRLRLVRATWPRASIVFVSLPTECARLALGASRLFPGPSSRLVKRCTRTGANPCHNGDTRMGFNDAW